MKRNFAIPAALAAAILLSACSSGLPQPLRGSVWEAPAHTSASTAYEAGKGHLAAGRLGLAVEYFRTAQRLDPASVDALNGLGVTYDRLGRHALAERAFLEALSLAPRDVATLNNLGWSRHLRGETAVAAFYLTRALDLDPVDGVVQANLAAVEAARRATGKPPADRPVYLVEAALAPSTDPSPLIERRSEREHLLVIHPPAPPVSLLPEPPPDALDGLERVAVIAEPLPDVTGRQPATEEVAAAREAAPSPPPLRLIPLPESLT